MSGQTGRDLWGLGAQVRRARRKTDSTAVTLLSQSLLLGLA